MDRNLIIAAPMGVSPPPRESRAASVSFFLIHVGGGGKMVFFGRFLRPRCLGSIILASRGYGSKKEIVEFGRGLVVILSYRPTVS